MRYNKSVLPYLSCEHGGGSPLILADMICGRIGNDSIEQLNDVVTEFKVDGSRILISFYDGEKVFLQTNDPEEVEMDLNGLGITGDPVMVRVDREGRRVLQVESGHSA